MNTNVSYPIVPIVVAALGLLSWSSCPSAAAEAPKPATHTVTIDGTSFQPAMLTVKPGDSIVWVNKDPFPHTATSEAGGFDSGVIQPDKSWTYTPKRKGKFAYICTLHPTMKATLRVE